MYFQVVRYITLNKNLQLPLSYNSLDIQIHPLANGAKLIFIHDPFSREDAYAVNVPTGYFNEDVSSPAGISNMVSLGMMRLENKDDTSTYNRTVLHEAQSTTWSGLASKIDDGIKTFCNDFGTFLQKMDIEQEIALNTFE